MTLNEYIDELRNLQKEGKGEYKMRWCYWSEVGDVTDSPLVFDDEQTIYI